jgi:hypothetical protein
MEEHIVDENDDAIEKIEHFKLEELIGFRA